MRHLRLFIGMVATAGLVGILAVSPAHADPPFEPPGLARALAAQALHTESLMRIGGVVGTATGLGEDGNPAVLVFTERPGIAGIPQAVDGVRVVIKVTGKIYALHHRPGHGGGPPGGGGGGGDDSSGDCTSETTAYWDRPVPIGISTGNADECSAGTIGARVKDSGGKVYALSNNHVYARENKATKEKEEEEIKGDEILQPGRYDTNCSVDLDNHQIASLYNFVGIIFNCNCRGMICFCSPPDNEVDAAIAKIAILDPDGNGEQPAVDNATPSCDGYGTPKSVTVFDDVENFDLGSLVGKAVQKYGRTTKLTQGKITGVNATVIVGYKSGYARFVKQIIVESNTSVIKAGDSGSLLVTDPDRSPVGLLFAGNSTGKMAIANQIEIDLVLSAFDVAIDGE